MRYKPLGRTGVLVSELCFGTMTFGKEADEAECGRMFAACRDAGVNFFDCANVYSGGQAETILGKLVRGCRDELVLTTKAAQVAGPDVNALGASRRHLMLEVEKSLKRLGTDRIDIYFIHHFDPLTPMDETLRALDDLVRQGKVLYPGASNWAAWQTAKALGISLARGLARFECLEPMYNLVKRQVEVEILPLALSENLAVIPYNPLAAGLLTGKYASGHGQGRIAENKMYNTRYSDPVYHQVAERFAAFARERGLNPVSLAVRWAASHPGVTAPIIGARSVEQLKDSLAAACLDVDRETLDAVTALSVAPPLATDRLEEAIDPGYKTRNRQGGGK
ncbi:General stress protein 69 [Fundidesulfovibrio magnetotacticus]|uniref:General stress protein 69 n=1 Tax=Fundidesulfovibrio magnetotacticus TaxID=2730080 RepID=A0A6V8LSL5_9BACT|nr:aldo/keto reductase [Fundidesulfovibrio magnetotacticus]GFK92607.1 General stress protein 69 [Fundidesulfovibrio magnetotacticus]